MAILSWRRIPLAILLCEQFIHLTNITLRPNKQLLSNLQHAFELLPASFGLNYNYPTTIWVSIVAQMYKFLVDFFFQFLFRNCSW